jgi:hypothetical protein
MCYSFFCVLFRSEVFFNSVFGLGLSFLGSDFVALDFSFCARESLCLLIKLLPVRSSVLFSAADSFITGFHLGALVASFGNSDAGSWFSIFIFFFPLAARSVRADFSSSAARIFRFSSPLLFRSVLHTGFLDGFLCAHPVQVSFLLP